MKRGAMGFNILLFLIVVSMFLQFMGPAAGLNTKSIALEFLTESGQINTSNPVVAAVGILLAVTIGAPLLLIAINAFASITGLSTLSINFPNPYTYFMPMATVLFAWLVIYPYQLFSSVVMDSFIAFFLIGILTFAMFWAILDWYKQVPF